MKDVEKIVIDIGNELVGIAERYGCKLTSMLSYEIIHKIRQSIDPFEIQERLNFDIWFDLKIPVERPISLKYEVPKEGHYVSIEVFSYSFSPSYCVHVKVSTESIKNLKSSIISPWIKILKAVKEGD